MRPVWILAAATGLFVLGWCLDYPSSEKVSGADKPASETGSNGIEDEPVAPDSALAVRSISWSTTGDRVLARFGSDTSSIVRAEMFDLEDPGMLHTFATRCDVAKHSTLDPLTAAYCLPSGNGALLGTRAGKCWVEYADGRPSVSLPWGLGGIDTFALDSTGTRLAVVSDLGAGAIFDTETFSSVCEWTGNDRTVMQAAFSVDGRRLLLTGPDRIGIEVRDSLTGVELARLGDFQHRPRSIAVLGSEGLICSAGMDGRLCVWNLESGELVWDKEVDPLGLLSVAANPDGSLIAAAACSGEIQLWDPVARRPLRQLHGHEDCIFVLQFSNSGMLASGGADGLIRVWDVSDNVSVITRRATVAGTRLEG